MGHLSTLVHPPLLGGHPPIRALVMMEKLQGSEWKRYEISLVEKHEVRSVRTKKLVLVEKLENSPPLYTVLPSPSSSVICVDEKKKKKRLVV